MAEEAKETEGAWKKVGSKLTKKKDHYVSHLNDNHDEAQAKKQYQHNYRRTASLMAQVLWQEKIKDLVNSRESRTKATCVMYYLLPAGELGYTMADSGYPVDMKTNTNALRTLAKIDLAKKTYCAEEHILQATRGQANDMYLFSVAFNTGGQIPACEGCKKLLAMYGIDDLFFPEDPKLHGPTV